MMREQSARMREDLLRQFSSADGHEPAGRLQGRASARRARDGATRQELQLEAMREQMVALKLELQGLRDEREKPSEVAAERERGTAKGRPYEEAVAEALDAIAIGQGDDCDAVGDFKGAVGRNGDVVVAIDGCAGPARGRIVFEAKNSELSKPGAQRSSRRREAQRDAAYGVRVVPSRGPPAGPDRQLREVNGDKLFVVYDPEEGSRLALEVAYTLARARVIAKRGGDGGIDSAALAQTSSGRWPRWTRCGGQAAPDERGGGIEQAARVWRGWPSGCGRTWLRFLCWWIPPTAGVAGERQH